MGMSYDYAVRDPARADIDALAEPAVLEFGAPWCGYCRAVQPLLAAAFARHPGLRHIKIEDGKGRRLGRSFGIKLWPTLVFLSDGKEQSRLVRPGDFAEILQAMDKIASQDR